MRSEKLSYRFSAIKFGKFLSIIIVLLFFTGLIVAAEETEASPEKWSGITGFFLAFISGLLLSFTPCVWPMYPITSSVILNSSASKTKKMAFSLSMVFVLGLAVTYSILGALTGKMGSLVSNYLKSLWIVIALSIILIVFGLSMLGLFEIRMPSSLSTKVFSGKRKGFAGVFVMGLLSGLVLTPCVTPVVGALVAFVIRSGSWITGASYFFAFALGMGTILIVIGTLSGALNALPKPGKWMLHVKRAFGVIMIGVALYIAFPVVAPAIRDKTGADEAASSETSRKQDVESNTIKWISDLSKGLELANSQNKPVMIDFYADWCYYCKEMDKNVFPVQSVIDKSREFVMIKFDATSPSSEDRRILTRYEIVGFPTTVFIDTKGETHKLTGYLDANELIEAMNEIR